jgi:UDP-2,3-diacylglucosamine pyrophosphatase LpxH
MKTFAMKTNQRKVAILVLSDIHLGTYGCSAKDLLVYLRSIKPEIVVLNGDIIDIWQFSKNYWPKSHMKVVRHIMGWISKGVRVYYIPGNHDETLRRFAGFSLGTFSIVNKLVLDLPNGEKAWMFHGDVFDVTMKHSKWLAKLGAVGYDTLILINSVANFFSEKIFKKGKLSLSKKIKSGVKSAVKFIDNFETTSADIAIMNKYDYVVCGHIHQPEIKEIITTEGGVTYMNSGDWIENLTSLEYVEGAWSIYRYSEDALAGSTGDDEEEIELTNNQLFDDLLGEFNLMRS